METYSEQLSLLDEEIVRELARSAENADGSDGEQIAESVEKAESAASAQTAKSADSETKNAEYGNTDNVSRTPFVIHDFDPPRDKEMAVFTHAKKLSEYIFVITEKSPKKLRWSIVSRLQNASTELIEHLYRANYEREESARAEYQSRATVCLSLIDFYADTAKRMKAINMHQMSVIARQLGEVGKLLKGWIKSGKRA